VWLCLATWAFDRWYICAGFWTYVDQICHSTSVVTIFNSSQDGFLFRVVTSFANEFCFVILLGTSTDQICCCVCNSTISCVIHQVMEFFQLGTYICILILVCDCALVSSASDQWWISDEFWTSLDKILLHCFTDYPIWFMKRWGFFPPWDLCVQINFVVWFCLATSASHQWINLIILGPLEIRPWCWL
jgi:hypothetical protein